MFSTILSTLSRGVGAATLFAKAHGPLILTVGGVAAMGTGAVMAATKAVDHKETFADVNGDLEYQRSRKHLYKDSSSYAKDLLEVYGRKAQLVMKVYGPSIATIAVGGSMILTGHGLLAARNTALVAAYKGLDSAFRNYRDHVKLTFGEDAEDKMYKKSFTYTVDPEDGDEKKHAEIVNQVAVPSQFSPYARCFDQTNPNWEPSAEMNKYWVMCVQEQLQHRLNTKGYVFLNDVYRRLGMEESKAGNVVGWHLASKGDHYIDLGLFQNQALPFMNGDEHSVWIDPNVNGPILDLREWKY